MHYYKFNIADWHLATSHLSLEEEAVYFKLINYYYDSEQCIPKETQSVIRRLRLGNHEETVGLILKEFFDFNDGFWHHARCDEVIASYHKKADTNKKVGKLGGRPKKINDLGDNPQITQMVSKNNPQITLTTNQEPITSREPTTEKSKKRKTVLNITKDTMPESYEDFCKAERPDLDPLQTYYKFCDHWLGCGETKADWFATWRNWVRNERKQVKAKPTVDFFDELMRTAK
jgi:uncharacterized protein YdaU (DUF1376 family)